MYVEAGTIPMLCLHQSPSPLLRPARLRFESAGNESSPDADIAAEACFVTLHRWLEQDLDADNELRNFRVWLEMEGQCPFGARRNGERTTTHHRTGIGSRPRCLVYAAPESTVHATRLLQSIVLAKCQPTRTPKAKEPIRHAFASIGVRHIFPILVFVFTSSSLMPSSVPLWQSISLSMITLPQHFHPTKSTHERIVLGTNSLSSLVIDIGLARDYSSGQTIAILLASVAFEGIVDWSCSLEMVCHAYLRHPLTIAFGSKVRRPVLCPNPRLQKEV